MKSTTKSNAKLASRERVRKHRESLRAMGLRPVQIWVPDTRKSGFAAEAHRQSASVNDPEHDREVFEFMDAVLADTPWD